MGIKGNHLHCYTEDKGGWQGFFFCRFSSEIITAFGELRKDLGEDGE